MVQTTLFPLAFLVEFLVLRRLLLLLGVILPPEDVVLYLVEKGRDNLEANLDLVVVGDSVLHGYDYAAEKLGGLEEAQSHLIDQFWVVQVVKLDVVADLGDLANVEGAFFLREIGRNFLPSL